MAETFPTLSALTAEAESVIFAQFNEIDAFELGQAITDIAITERLAVVVNIRTSNRTLYHAATPGSSAMNDNWARRKSNTALMTGKSSLYVGIQNREKGEPLALAGLDGADFADHGGAVPVVVRGAGMVAVATVSGLPQLEDHALVLRAMHSVLS